MYQAIYSGYNSIYNDCRGPPHLVSIKKNGLENVSPASDMAAFCVSISSISGYTMCRKETKLGQFFSTYTPED